MRVAARTGAFPTGAVLGLLGVAAAVMVAALHLDRLPFVFCSFRRWTGLPCATCGSTRVLGRLAAGDVAGAVRQNPLAFAAVVVVALWAMVDMALLPWRRALIVELSERETRFGVIVGFAAFLANWAYLLMTFR